LANRLQYFLPILFFLILASNGKTAVPADSSRAVSGVRFDSSPVSVRTAPAEKLDPFWADDAFLYDREPPAPVTLWEQLKRWLVEKIAQLLFSKGGAVVWRIFVYVLVAAVLIFVVAKLMRTDPRGLFYHTGARIPADSRQIPENIHALDFDRLIAEAVAQKHYRLAIRLSFLAVLKKLADQDLIAWRLEKTNHEYLQELKKTGLQPFFAEIVYLFENIWYGEFGIDEPVFQQAMEAFREFDLRLAER
jgi:hypothetical protein